MKLFLILTLILFSSASVLGQSITFCSQVSQSGEPVKPATEWSITAAGGYVNILFHNGSKNIGAPNVSYRIARENADGKFEEIQVKNVVTDKSGKFASLEYRFLSPGLYRIKVVDGQKLLATGTVSIRISSSSVTGSGGIDTYYYSGASLSSGYNMNSSTGKYEKETSAFIVDPRSGGYVSFKLSTERAINSSKLVVEVFRLKDIGTEHHETLQFQVDDQKSTWTTFNLTFYDAGKYQVKVFNGENVWICDGFITVGNK